MENTFLNMISPKIFASRFALPPRKNDNGCRDTMKFRKFTDGVGLKI